MIKLDTKILYFGASNPNIKEISEGKFLTSFKSIACCFAIDLNDVYGELNKKYTSINWSYNQWNKSENYLNKQLIPEKIKIINNAKEWIKTTGTSIGYLYSIDVDDFLNTADWLFDNMMVDILVQQKIETSKKNIMAAIDKVKRIINVLERQL